MRQPYAHWRNYLSPTVLTITRYDLLLKYYVVVAAAVIVPQTEIYVEVDDVPVTGISASERVSVTASATVNSDAAMDTLVSYSGPRTALASCLRTIFTCRDPLALAVGDRNPSSATNYFCCSQINVSVQCGTKMVICSVWSSKYDQSRSG